MSLMAVQCTMSYTDTLVPDMTTHTLHYADGTPSPLSDPDYASVASDVGHALQTYYTTVSSTDSRGFMTRVYELDDATPRAPKVDHVIAPGGPTPDALGPRQVAQVLAFFSQGRNLPRNRGRIYLGPFQYSVMAGWHVNPGIMTACAALATALGAAGPDSVKWVTFSTVGAGHHDVTNWWCDNRWDTQRRRLPKATARNAGTVAA